MTIISHKTLKLIINLVVFLLIIAPNAHGIEPFRMKNPYGDTIDLTLALTRSQHTQGLSGLPSSQFPKSQGMLFVNPEMAPRRFWMPNTLFNLDIIFLDRNLSVVGIEKNVPAHPGLQEPPLIYKTQTYQAQYVLETKALTAFGKKLKKNDRLRFSGPTSLSEIALSTRLGQ